MATAAEGTASDLPIAQVIEEGLHVKVIWNDDDGDEEVVRAQTLEVYADGPYNFSATRYNRKEPLVKTFNNLLECDGGVLTISSRRYRIRAQKQQQTYGSKQQPIKTNILGDGVVEKLRSAVFYFKDDKRKPIGTGFFFSPTVAISSAHIFLDSTKVGTKRTGYFGRPQSGKTCKLKVDWIDPENDFIVFVNEDGEKEATEYLDLSPEGLDIGDQCVLVAFQLEIHGEMNELGKEPSVGVFPGTVAKAHNRHFVYSAPSFAGDSGGAIIFNDGKAVGMHIMTVNQAHELKRLKSLDGDSTSDDVNSVEKSVNSLVESLSSGALAISISAIMAAYDSKNSKRKSEQP